MTKKLITRMNKKTALLRAKNDVTHAIQLKLHERTNKKQIKIVVTSNGCNKNGDDEIKRTKRRPIIVPAIAVRLLKTYRFYQNIAKIFDIKTLKTIL